MSWYESIDFISSFPSPSPFHTGIDISVSESPAYDDHDFGSSSSSSPEPGPYPTTTPTSASGSEFVVDHFQSLERDFFQNFTCCGLCHADLHELIEHFEVAHVMVIDANGIPIYPSPSPSSHDTTMHPYASLVFNYPGQQQPLQQLDAERDVMADFDAFGQAGPGDMGYSSSEQSSPLVAEPVGLPPSSFEVSASVVETDSEGGEGDEEMVVVGPRWPGRRTGTGTRVSVRERSFKCPHPGCPKTYKNPNGLKYHVAPLEETKSKVPRCKFDPSLSGKV